MVEPYLGEIKLFSFNSIPRGWHICDGASMPVSQNQALYSLIGNTYGGNNVNFNLPDLRGRTLVGAYGTVKAPPYGLGISAGQDQVPLAVANLPTHNHSLMTATTAGDTSGANGVVYAQVTQPSAAALYGPPSSPQVAMEASTVQTTGGGAAHYNMQPFLALVFCIATQGIYPTRP